MKMRNENLILWLNLIYVFIGNYFLGCSGFRSVCFKNIGCFSQKYPWVSLSRPFPSPEDPKKIDVSILFFSREQVKGEWIKVYPNITFNVNGFKPNRRTVTITHGFASSATTEWVLEMKDKYLENVDANIFLVNWAKGASGINYFKAASNARVTGAVLGRFGKYLIENEGVKYSDLHLIGHSLGSHISAYAATIMNNASSEGYKVFRITGLDVAQPGFQSLPAIVRLSKDKAEFVEAIHSDAKLFIPFFGFGYLTQIGDVDFYLNRGYNQPNCIDLVPIKDIRNIDQLKNITVEVINKAITCSHGRAYEIYTASIDKSVKCKFVGHRLIFRLPATSNQFSCGLNGRDCITMGLDTPNQKPKGSFQVMTSGRKPFCCYNYSVLRGCKNSPNQIDSPIFDKTNSSINKKPV